MKKLIESQLRKNARLRRQEAAKVRRIREGMAEEWQRRLEDMIDASSVANVLTLLSGVCYEKEEHLQSNWQDDATARTWHRDGKTIDSIVSRITN